MISFLAGARRHPLVAATAGVILVAVLFCLFHQRHDHPTLSAIKDITAQLTGPATEHRSRTERRGRWNEWHRQLWSLPATARREYWQQRRSIFREFLRDFARAPKFEQVQTLKQVLGGIQEFRSQWEKSPDGKVTGPNWWTELSSLDRERRSQEWLDMSEPEERAQVTSWLQMLAGQSLALGMGACPSPWGDDAPT